MINNQVQVVTLAIAWSMGHRERGLLVMKGDLYQLAADLGAPAAAQPAPAPALAAEAAEQPRQAAQTPQTIAAWQRLAADGQTLDSSGVHQPGAQKIFFKHRSLRTDQSGHDQQSSVFNSGFILELATDSKPARRPESSPIGDSLPYIV